ncbi:MAG: S-methyl-5-thioribose-1-phosphate isomerase, partial [Candidatus Eisenbacteria sp.]|nr:S-methyl-5-thioribose-1-phosphate isomerase [Candidatus Eisenbacteria bacterium]
MTPTIAWVGDAETAAIRILDQTRLPEEEVYLELREIPPLCEAIASLRIRGAPAIGIAGAYGVALAAQRAVGSEAGDEQIRAAVARAAEQLRAARPTAVNLAWGVDRIVERFAAAWGSERGVTAARRAAA